MSDISQVSLGSRIFRMPRFGADARRTPSLALWHALPAFLYLAMNVWLAGMGAAWAIALLFPFPLAVELGIAGVFALPCLALNWAVLVMCVEAEAQLES